MVPIEIPYVTAY